MSRYVNPYAKTTGGMSSSPTQPKKPRGRPPNVKPGTIRKSKYKNRNGTQTKTKQRKKLSPGKYNKSGDNSSVSFTTYGSYSKPKQLLATKLLGHQIREYLVATNATSAQGKQGVAIVSLLSRGDLDQLKTDANINTTTNNDVSLYIKTAKLKLLIKNQSNVLGKIFIYDIISINNGFSTSFDDPQECWDKGFSDMGTASVSNAFGATPYGSPEFRKNFRITKVSAIPMEPGQEHTHVVKKNMNWLIKSTKWDGQSTVNVKGLTYFTMIVFTGSLAHNSQSASEVTISPLTIDYLYRRQYNMAYMYNNKPVYNAPANLTAIIAANLEHMGEDQDVRQQPL